MYVLHVYCMFLRLLVVFTYFYFVLDKYIFVVGTKLMLNVRLNQYLTVDKQSDKMVRLICVNYSDLQQDTSNAKIGTFLIKTKTTYVSIY